MKQINFSTYKNIVILTGAGVSVASGIPSFRGENGLWEKPEFERLSNPQSFFDNPELSWNLWGMLRKSSVNAEPNPAHKALSFLEGSLSDEQNYLLITQNIDGLHQQAGSKNVVEVHGNIHISRCSRADCSLMSFRDDNTDTLSIPKCPICDSALRPDIVAFNEPIPVDAEMKVKRALRYCDLFIAIGTSGSVYPASSYVRGAEYVGARTVFINDTPLSPPNPYYQETILGKCEEILPGLVGC